MEHDFFFLNYSNREAFRVFVDVIHYVFLYSYSSTITKVLYNKYDDIVGILQIITPVIDSLSHYKRNINTNSSLAKDNKQNN